MRHFDAEHFGSGVPRKGNDLGQVLIEITFNCCMCRGIVLLGQRITWKDNSMLAADRRSMANLAGEHTQCENCAIRDEAVCKGLSADELLKLNRIARRRRVPAGQLIFGEGEPRDFFGNVVSGVVKLTKTLVNGRQHIVGLLFPPDFLGRAFRDENPYFAEAATDVEICVFPGSNFERLITEFPGLEHRLFRYTLAELDACQEWMLLLARKSAEERVASFLLMVAKRAARLPCAHAATGMHPGVSFQLPLARADIADYLGLTIETVSRQVTKLRTKRAIELTGTREIRVADLDYLERMANNAEED
jgi:CRP/FNR family transcriptional regulator